MKKVGSNGAVLFVNTVAHAARPYIVHSSLPNDVVSDTGLHFAVVLHGRVFDNLTPEGASECDWMQAYGFAMKNGDEGTFADVEVAKWSYQQFLAYLKRANRTPFGRPRQSTAPNR